MSRIGIISQEYENTAELFQKLNDGIILLKKKVFNLESSNQVLESEILEAQRFLAEILKQIIAGLNENASPEDFGEENLSIPPFFIKRLQEKYQKEREWYIDDIQELQQILSDAVQQGYEVQSLKKDLIKRLDELCDQLDAETTQLYRKLWRR